MSTVNLAFRVVLALSLSSLVSGCLVTDEAASEDGDGTSAQVVSALTVGGHYCPQRGEIAGRNIPSDNLYYFTSFGVGPDNGPMACGGTANGTWLYIADSWRFGCRARVRLTDPRTGRWCVAQVADVGPNICVERAAGRPIIDGSPMISRHIWGRSGMGWSERVPVRAELVPSSTALGCGTGSTTPTPTPTPSGGACHSSTLGREVAVGTCLQSRLDSVWYQCASDGWRADRNIPATRRGPVGACAAYYPLASASGSVESLGDQTCVSQTLNRNVNVGTCVQSRFDREWYQCTTAGWWLDAGIPSARRSRAGACTSYYSL